MINVNDIKQRALISARLKYEREIEIISDYIKTAADNGEFMLYIDPYPIKLKRQDWTKVLNVFDNAGFITGIKDNKLLISWFNNLKEINLLEDYNEKV